MRPLILFGGGLDSCALTVRNAHLNPFLLYFDYGQKALIGELRALRYFKDKYRLDSYIATLDPHVIPLSPLTEGKLERDAKQHARNYIPGRNLLFGAFAFSFA